MLAPLRFYDARCLGHSGLSVLTSHLQIRTTVALPHGTGNTVRIAVLAEGPAADEARAAGADIVGMADLIEDISAGEFHKHTSPALTLQLIDI